MVADEYSMLVFEYFKFFFFFFSHSWLNHRAQPGLYLSVKWSSTSITGIWLEIVSRKQKLAGLGLYLCWQLIFLLIRLWTSEKLWNSEPSNHFCLMFNPIKISAKHNTVFSLSFFSILVEYQLFLPLITCCIFHLLWIWRNEAIKSQCRSHHSLQFWLYFASVISLAVTIHFIVIGVEKQDVAELILFLLTWWEHFTKYVWGTKTKMP